MAVATRTEGSSRELASRDGWTRDRLLAHQRTQLGALLRHAVERSAYYRETLGPAPDPAELASFPVLSKPTLMAEFDRILTDPRLRRAEIEAGGPGAGHLGEYRAFTTSGTTGVAGLFVFSRAEWSAWVDVGFRVLASCGFRPGMRLATIGAPSPEHITRQLFAAFGAGGERPPALYVTTPLEEIVRVLNEYRPEAITTYASIAGLLAEEQLQGRLAIEPELVAVGSEVLTEENEQRILEAWGIRATNAYASTEVLFVAVRRPGESMWDVCEDTAIVEAVDERNRPVPPGVPSYKVLVTNLVQRTQPLIRYELSDSVVLARGTAAGRPWARIARIDGRSDDILRLPRADGGEVSVLPYRLRAPFAAFADVVQYQIVQEPEGLRVRVVLGAGAGRGVLGEVRQALAAQLREAGAAPPAIVVEAVPEIERESGHAAKLKIVKALRR